MKRLIPILVIAASLALPAASEAAIKELGSKAPAVTGSCPAAPCSVMTRMTAYQGRAGTVKNPYVVPHSGYIVAFTVALGNPNKTQMNYFTNGDGSFTGFGSPPTLRVSILRKGKKRKSRLNHRLMAQSKAYRLDSFFGSSPTFALTKPLRVRPKYIVALTTDTWAPILTEKLTRASWWRTSRPKKSCKNVSQRAEMETTGVQKTFGCTYFNERMAYTASYIQDPTPTTKKKTPKKK